MKSDAENKSAMARCRGLRDLGRAIRVPGVLSRCLFKSGLYLRGWSFAHSGQTTDGSVRGAGCVKICWCFRRCALYRHRNQRSLPSGLGRIHLHVQDGTGRDG